MTANRRHGSPRLASVLGSALVLLGATLPAPRVYAQAPTGTILGSVKDSSGGAVPGDDVRATKLGAPVAAGRGLDGHQPGHAVLPERRPGRRRPVRAAPAPGRPLQGRRHAGRV